MPSMNYSFDEVKLMLEAMGHEVINIRSENGEMLIEKIERWDKKRLQDIFKVSIKNLIDVEITDDKIIMNQKLSLYEDPVECNG